MGSMNITRRGALKLTAASVGASTLTALGFSPAQAQGAVRAFKLERTTETRNTCPYCSVGCGVIMYSVGDRSKNVTGKIIHIEGDPDHPTNRGTLCPKGAGLIDFINAKTAPAVPRVPRARRQGVEAHLLGRGDRQDRASREGRPRQELHRQERRRPDGEPLADDRLPGGFRDLERDGMDHLQGGAIHGDGRLR